MKLLFKLIAFALSINYLSAYAAETLTQEQIKVKNYFLSNEEPKVKDVMWNGYGILKLGMVDDGSNRNGYAEYACLVLNDYGFKNKKIWVQIIDINKLMKSKKWVKLGESHCP